MFAKHALSRSAFFKTATNVCKKNETYIEKYYSYMFAVASFSLRHSRKSVKRFCKKTAAAKLPSGTHSSALRYTWTHMVPRLTQRLAL